MFFDNWQGIWRTVAVGVPAYLLLLFLLRVSGKRTLSKMNAFDLVVTVALGSTLATILLSSDTALAEGITALALLILLQFVITWLSVRSHRVSHWVKAEPRLLFHNGEFLWQAMKEERVNKGEILQAIRSQGIKASELVNSVVLETDGSFSVMKQAEAKSESALANVWGFEASAEGEKS